MYVRSTWSEPEDGVLWTTTADGVVAREIAAGSPGDRAGVRVGDILAEIDRTPVDSESDVVARLHHASSGDSITYTLIRTKTRESLRVALAPMPSGARGLYFVLAAGRHLHAARRRRRPRCAGPTTRRRCISSGCRSRSSASSRSRSAAASIALDWVFYWGDAVALLLLPPLFLHFTLVFPERPTAWVRGDAGAHAAAADLPAGAAARRRARARGRCARGIGAA